MSTPIQNALNFIKSDLEVTLIPVVIGALQAYQKSPGALGLAAAELYVLGNAPAALLQAESGVISAGIADLNAILQTELAAQAAAKPAT